MRKTDKITLEDARLWVQKAIAERGEDFNYQEAYAEHRSKWGGVLCNYYVDGQPACIVGVALTLGAEFTRWDFHESGTVAAQPWDITPEASEYLGEVQQMQDGGSTWGEAFAAAEAETR